jgi:hypothetical protein
MGLTDRTMGLFGKGEAKVDKRIREVALFGDEFPRTKTMLDSYTDSIEQCDEVIRSANEIIADYQELAKRSVKKDGTISVRFEGNSLETAVALAKLSKWFEARDALVRTMETRKLLARLGELDEASSLKDTLTQITNRITEDPGLSVFMVSDASAQKDDAGKKGAKVVKVTEE